MGPHTKTLSKSGFHHIRSFKQIRSSMDHSTTVSVALALVSSRLDYVNSILPGSPLKHIARLQRTQHALARVVLQQRSHALSTPSAPDRVPKEGSNYPHSPIKHYTLVAAIPCRPLTASHNPKVHVFMFISAAFCTTS